MLHINRFDAQQHLGAVVGGDRADPVVEFDAGHRAAGRRERRARPFDFHVGAEPGHPQAPVPDPAVQPRAEAEQLEFGDRARGQPVAAGLVAGKLRGVDHQHVAAAAGGPGGRRGTGRSGADDDHVRTGSIPESLRSTRRVSTLPSMLDQ